jgi:hypothetical protein
MELRMTFFIAALVGSLNACALEEGPDVGQNDEEIYVSWGWGNVSYTDINDSGDLIIVGPGAALDVDMVFSIDPNKSSCLTCNNQLVVGVGVGTTTSKECLYNGGVGEVVSQSASVSLTAPTQPGMYPLWVKPRQQANCADALTASNDGTPAGYVQVVEMHFSSAGPIAGYACTQILEPADPHTWNDNYLCSTGNALQWSYAGAITDMRCTKIYEGADPYGWDDNYLCVPETSSLFLQWSDAGPIAGKTCVNWNEVSDPHAWFDNYLCY